MDEGANTITKRQAIFAVAACILLLSFQAQAKISLCSEHFWKTASLKDVDNISNPDLICGEDKRRIIHLAAQFARANVLERLLDKSNVSLLMWAVGYGNANAKDDNGTTPLMLAAKNGERSITSASF